MPGDEGVIPQGANPQLIVTTADIEKIRITGLSLIAGIKPHTTRGIYRAQSVLAAAAMCLSGILRR